MLTQKNVFLNCSFKNKDEVLEVVFKTLKDNGCNELYIDSILEREKIGSFNIGQMIAIPHGTYEASSYITKSMIYVWQLKKPIQWDDSEVKLVIALALKSEDQLDILQNIAVNAMDEDFFNDLLKNPSLEKMIQLTQER